MGGNFFTAPPPLDPDRRLTTFARPVASEPDHPKRTPSPRERMPWDGPPHNVIGGFGAWRSFLRRSGSACVVLQGLVVYPEIFEFEILVRVREATPDIDWPTDLWMWRRLGTFTGELPPGLLDSEFDSPTVARRPASRSRPEATAVSRQNSP